MSIENTPSNTDQPLIYWDPSRELFPITKPGEIAPIVTEVSMPPRLVDGASREQALEHAIMLRRGMVALMGAYDANTRIDNLGVVVAEIQEQKKTLPSATGVGVLATRFSIKYDILVGRNYQPRRAQ